MKKILAHRTRPACLAAFALGATLTVTSHASISLTGGTVTETFTAQPPATSWSTTAAVAGVFGTSAATITTDNTADGRVGTAAFQTGVVTAAFLSTQLPAAAIAGTVANGTNAQTLYHSTGFVGTPPTGSDGTLLMATLTNNTGGTILSLSVAYDLGIQNNNVPQATGLQLEEIPGHRVYWSLTGLANSWTPIGDFGFRATGVTTDPATRTQGFSMVAPVANWANGTNAYIVWLDDNATNNPDGTYYLDNIAFTPTPEPTSGLLAMSALGVFGLVRRRVAK